MDFLYIDFRNPNKFDLYNYQDQKPTLIPSKYDCHPS